MNDLRTIRVPGTLGSEILRIEIGSTLHGTGLPGGEDRDEMGIYIERPEVALGVAESKGHWVYRTADERREGKGKDPKSQPGDLDLTCFSLRKWARLALKGNPSVLLVLHAPESHVVYADALGRELRVNAEWFASKRAGAAFLGYMQQQRGRMTGLRGKAGRVRVMPDGGVDWKYAMHLLRLGWQGKEFLQTGRITLPVPGEVGIALRAVRQGAIPFEVVMADAYRLEGEVEDLIRNGPLPEEPNVAAVDAFVVDCYLRSWQ